MSNVSLSESNVNLSELVAARLIVGVDLAGRLFTRA